MPRFFIEQIALCPPDPAAAIELLTALGLSEWAKDVVIAHGTVHESRGQLNKAQLAFNYQATRGLPIFDDEQRLNTDLPKPLELEVLHYEKGRAWTKYFQPSVSHLGMHVTQEELDAFRALFTDRGIKVAQEVFTQQHTNPVIAGKRWYNYVIFNTRGILGVDLKFIVRHDTPAVVAHVPLEY